MSYSDEDFETQKKMQAAQDELDKICVATIGTLNRHAPELAPVYLKIAADSAAEHYFRAGAVNQYLIIVQMNGIEPKPDDIGALKSIAQTAPGNPLQELALNALYALRPPEVFRLRAEIETAFGAPKGFTTHPYYFGLPGVPDMPSRKKIRALMAGCIQIAANESESANRRVTAIKMWDKLLYIEPARRADTQAVNELTKHPHVEIRAAARAAAITALEREEEAKLYRPRRRKKPFNPKPSK